MDPEQNNPDSQPDPNDPQANPPAPDYEQPAEHQAAPASPKRKRKRRWLKIVLVTFAVVLLILALIPTLLSTAPVRRWAVGKINQNLNGTVQVQDWSLSWFGGATITGVRVLDAEGRQILEAPRLSTELSPFKLITGRLAFGQTRGEVSSFVLRFDPDGGNNFQDLVRTSPPRPRPRPRQPSETHRPAQPFTVPDISGHFVFDARGTIERPGQPALHVDKATVTADVPDINALIEHSADVRMRVEGLDGVGQLSLKGSLDLFDNNRLKPAVAKETLTVKDVRLADLRAFLPRTEQIEKLAGLANGQIVLDLAGNSGFFQGQLAVAEPTFGGVGGDVYTSRSPITLTIPRTSITAPKGLDHWQTVRVAVADDKRITLDFAEGRFEAFVDATPQAILNVLNRMPPGTDGRIQTSGAITKPGDLQQKLPNTLAFRKDITVVQGNYTQETLLAFTPAAAEFSADATLSDVHAVNKDNQPIELRPIAMDIHTTLPDFTDVKLILDSAFASASITGPNLAAVSGPIKADLAEMQRELGQIFEFGQVKLAGILDSRLTSEGDILRPGGYAKLRYDGTVQNVMIDLPGKAPIREPNLYLGAGATLVRGQEQFLSKIPGMWLSATAGARENPTLDMEIRADADLVGDFKPGDAAPNISFTLPSIKLTRLSVDLPRALEQYRTLLPEKVQRIELASGRLTGSADAKYVDGIVSILPASIVRIAGFAVRQDAPAGVIGRRPSQGENLSFAVVKALTVTRNDKYPIIDGVVSTNVPFEPVLALLDAMKEPAAESPTEQGVSRTLAGNIATHIAISTDSDGAIRIQQDPKTASAEVVVMEGGRVAYQARNITFDTDISYKPSNATLWVRRLGIAASDGLTLAARGIIERLDRDPTFLAFPKDDDGGFVLELAHYDAKKLVPLIKAFIPPDNEVLSDLMLTGTYNNRRFVISGHYPLDKRFNEAIATLDFTGSLAFDTAQVAGLDMRGIQTYARAQNGVAVINGPRAPTTQPIRVNSGSMQLAGVTYDLTMPGGGGLYIPPGTHLLENVQVNTVFLDRLLGKAVPLLLGLDTAQSPLDMTVEEWNGRVPMAWLTPAEPGAPEIRSDARAVIRIRMQQARLGGGMIAPISGLMSGRVTGLGGLTGLGPLTARPAASDAGGIVASIDGTITIANGRITSDLPITIKDHRFLLAGSVDLRRMQIAGMNFVVPRSAVQNALPSNLDRLIPGDVTVPFSGNLRTRQFQFDVMGAITRSLLPGRGQGGNPLEALPGILQGLGGDKEKDKERDDKEKEPAKPRPPQKPAKPKSRK